MMKRPKLELKSHGFVDPVVIPRTEAPEVAHAKPIDAKRPSRTNTRVISGHFPEATLRRLKRIGLDEDKSIQGLLEEALEDLFGKYASKGRNYT